MALRALAAGVLGLAIGGCAWAPVTEPAPFAQPLPASGPVSECARRLALEERLIERHRVRDRQSARVPGYPYLRVNRTLAALGEGDLEAAALVTWLDALRELDLEARRLELANLPHEARAAIERADAGAPAAAECGRRLAALALMQPEAIERLRAGVRVADAYRLGWRVAGLYPLTSVPFLAGVEALHERFGATFRVPLDALAVRGRLVRYLPPADDARGPRRRVAARLAQAARDPLGRPLLSSADLDALFEHHAPVLEIDVVSEDDRPGRPRWQSDGTPHVDGAEPVAYRLLSYARLDGAVLTQLSYAFWFRARTATGALDLLAGPMDGIIWRVTLGSDGEPLLYDSVHACGCYHMLFPTDRVSARPPPARWEEPVLVAQRLERGPGRVVIRIAHRTHYVQRVYRDRRPSGGVVYAMADYDALRSMPLPGGGRRSLFAEDGLVRGTERAERWLFWPMGVASPGAMRQWGHHAVAFVGRRHFDDPDLIARYFRLQPSRVP